MTGEEFEPKRDLLDALGGIKEQFIHGSTNTKRKIVGLLLSNLRFSSNSLDLHLKQPFSSLFLGEKRSLWLGLRVKVRTKLPANRVERPYHPQCQPRTMRRLY